MFGQVTDCEWGTTDESRQQAFVFSCELFACAVGMGRANSHAVRSGALEQTLEQTIENRRTKGT